MTHHDHDHDHDHHHGHHHDAPHDHGEHHHHPSESPMSFEEKLQTLLSHWINHNNDHAANYLEWSKKTREGGRPDIAQLLQEASEMTGKITSVFEKAFNLSIKK